MVKLVNECCEVVFNRIVFQKRSPRCDWLGLPVGVHLLHGESEPVGLKLHEHVRQNGGIYEHALCGEIHKLFMDIIGQEGVVVELRGRLFIV